jgi:membrane-associated phospholipid phosphatase
VAALLAVAVGVTFVLFVCTVEGQLVDHEVMALFDPAFVRASGEVPVPLRVPVAGLFVGTLVVVVVVGLWRRVVRRMVAAVVAMGVTAGIAELLKEGLVRPDLAEELRRTGNSFPSGHVTAAAVSVFALLLVSDGVARWVVGVIGWVWVGAVGVSTLGAGWHRPSDVVGGVLLAAAVYMAATAVTNGRKLHNGVVGGGVEYAGWINRGKLPPQTETWWWQRPNGATPRYSAGVIVQPRARPGWLRSPRCDIEDQL